MWRLILIAFLYILLAFYLFPFLIVLIDAFKTNGDIMRNPFQPTVHITLDNFAQAIQEMNFLVAFFNTLVITVVSVALIILSSSMTAYFLARNKSKLSTLIFSAMVVAMLVPFQAIMIPLVTTYGRLGILSSRLTLIYMYIGFGCGMAVFIIHGFIRSSVPIALEEAAKLDGCGSVRTFFLVVFPLLKSVIATVVVLNVLWIWNDYLLPSLILVKPIQLTLPLSTFAFSNQMSLRFGPLVAALLLTILPILILYVALQRYIIGGVVAGAVKS